MNGITSARDRIFNLNALLAKARHILKQRAHDYLRHAGQFYVRLSVNRVVIIYPYDIGSLKLENYRVRPLLDLKAHSFGRVISPTAGGTINLNSVVGIATPKFKKYPRLLSDSLTV